MSYICFERDGCFFSVYCSIVTDELAKIAGKHYRKNNSKNIVPFFLLVRYIG